MESRSPMKKDAPKPQETAAPYKPTPADAQAFDAYMAARSKAAPRLKVVPTADGAGTITIDHPNKALGQIALMKALGTTDDDFADWLLKQLFYVGSKGSSPDEDGANFTHASPNKTRTPTIVRKTSRRSPWPTRSPARRVDRGTFEDLLRTPPKSF